MDDTQDIELGATTNEVSTVDATASTSEPSTDAGTDNNSLRTSIAAALDGYKPDEKVEEPAALPKVEAAAPVAPAVATTVDPITGRTVEPMKAPADWTPALREKWGSIDPQVQKFLLDRNRDINMTLQQTKEARDFKKQFDQAAGPMNDVLKQFNETPVQHAKQLFELSYALNTGHPAQKAQIFYNLIQHFKPDPQTLQALFSGQPVQVPPMTPAPKPQQSREDIAAEVNREHEEREQEQASQDAITAFANDPANEFFHDVRAQMGRLIASELVDGTKPMAEQLREAYDLAVGRNPEIQSLIASRQVTTPQAPAVQPRPIGSVKPSLGAGKKTSGSPSPKTAREAAELAWEQAVGNR